MKSEEEEMRENKIAFRLTHPDLEHASITTAGDIECPHCKAHIITPIGMNPYTRKVEKMIVHPLTVSRCNICCKPYILTTQQALLHNHIHFPDDKTYEIQNG